MITGVHAMFYSSRAPALRAFLRDKLGFTSFTDVGDGWLIFDAPTAEIGAHPASGGKGGMSGTHDISFYCDDLGKTVQELKGRGVTFVGAISERSYGRVARFKMPGGVSAELYQPRYKMKRRKGKA
jgi:hypothetical protein